MEVNSTESTTRTRTSNKTCLLFELTRTKKNRCPKKEDIRTKLFRKHKSLINLASKDSKVSKFMQKLSNSKLDRWNDFYNDFLSNRFTLIEAVNQNAQPRINFAKDRQSFNKFITYNDKCIDEYFKISGFRRSFVLMLKFFFSELDIPELLNLLKCQTRPDSQKRVAWIKMVKFIYKNIALLSKDEVASLVNSIQENQDDNQSTQVWEDLIMPDNDFREESFLNLEIELVSGCPN